MSRHIVDQTQSGGQVHRYGPGCSEPEPRVITGQKVTPEYVRGFADEWAAIEDPAARAFCRRLLEVLLSRDDAREALDIQP